MAAVWCRMAGPELRQSSDFLREIVSVEAHWGGPLFEDYSPRDFCGDGYSFAVYELPEAVAGRFKNPDERMLNEFPVPSDTRREWRVVSWREAPVPPDFSQRVDFALSELDRRAHPPLAPHHAAAREALRQSGTFYAAFIGPADIDFFVIDLRAGRFYAINHNT